MEDMYVEKTTQFSSVVFHHYSHRILHFWHFWLPNVWGVFPHTKQFSKTSAQSPPVELNSDPTEGKVQPYKSAPTPLPLQVPITSGRSPASLGSTNLLEQLTEP